MKRESKELNLLILGENISLFDESLIKNNLGISVKIINDNKYSESDYLNLYYELIDKAKYFNIFAINYRTKSEILNFFENFNKDYADTCINYNCYPFFLIDKNVYNKVELYKEIIKINQKREDLYKYHSKDIIEYDNDSLYQKLLEIYNYYFQKQDDKKYSRTLNIMVCGKKRTGKTYFINELLFENRGLSKENNYTTKVTCYEHKLFQIKFYDFPGFSDSEDKWVLDATNYITKFSQEYKDFKNKIHIIFYMLQSDSGRVLQDKEIEIIKNFIKSNIPIYFIASKVKKNIVKTFIRDFEKRLLSLNLENKINKLKSHLFIIDSTNKSIKSLLNSVIDDLNISKNVNDSIISDLINSNFINNSTDNINDKNEILIIPPKIIENSNIMKNSKKNNKIIQKMNQSIFFNDISSSFKTIEIKLDEFVETIKNESNTHWIPLLSGKSDLIKLSNYIKDEFKKFLPEEKIDLNFHELDELSEFCLDENLIGLLIDAIFCIPLICIFGSIGTISLIGLIPVYIITGKCKKNKIASLLKEKANNLLLKFKELSIDYDSIKNIAQNYNEIIDQFIEFSRYFDSEHENDIDLLEIKNKSII